MYSVITECVNLLADGRVKERVKQDDREREAKKKKRLIRRQEEEPSQKKVRAKAAHQ